jgi:mono/diheme cytochrome c family protein
MKAERTELIAMLLGLGMIGAWSSAALATGGDAGKAVYEKSCVSCHGKDGKGNPAMAKALGDKGLNLTAKSVAQMSDGEVLKILAEGKGKMPAQKLLSKDEQKQVLGYIRSFAK